jgi:hypothetical protein
MIMILKYFILDKEYQFNFNFSYINKQKMDLVRLYLTYLLDKVWSNQIAIKYQFR